MPTETKKTAPKRFLTGSTSFSMRSASTVSARMLPMMKAPKADEKPTLVEKTAMAQQRPSETTSSTSLLMRRRTRRRKMGMAKMPTTSQRMRKKPIFRMLPSIWPPLGLLPLAMADSMTIMTMARMSSRMSTDMTSPTCLQKSRMQKLAVRRLLRGRHWQWLWLLTLQNPMFGLRMPR